MPGVSQYTAAEIGDQLLAITFGPFAIATAVAGDGTLTSADLILPFVRPDKACQIVRVDYSTTVAGGSGALVRLLRQVVTAGSEVTAAQTISANTSNARAITTDIDLTATAAVNRRAALMGADATLAFTEPTAALPNGANGPPLNNLLLPGNRLVLDFAGTLTGLSGLMLTMLYTTKINTRE